MFENITLEMSLKPFKQTDESYIRQVCQKVFEQWRPLLKGRKSISIMLWVGDGSELLDYNGVLGDGFEWARFMGTANLPYLEDGAPLETSLHVRKQDYTKDPPKMTYGILKTVVAVFKEEGKKAFPASEIRLGETFDIGPEFSLSDFKYNRHREILGSTSGCDQFGFVDATATLHADSHPYAAYPEGIPEGTPFGTFLGRQSEIFLRDMGFDYLWLSNGLGFSADPWRRTGKLFDGERYYPEKLEDLKEKVFSFWALFRKECSFPLETRGTNNSVGIDYASDGVPLHDIYTADLNITAPPNSPWAALTDNYGLEMMGHMTRICNLPNSKFPFRYYLHDPWWVNSPWYDRYDGSPCDIYLPMAISRINANGEVESANSLNILSIDNSYGELPDQCVNEPLPHILKAEKNSADEPAPIVWVYPMREYTTSADASLLREMNVGDRFVCAAINSGFPLSCVVSTDNFILHSAELYKKSVLLSPVPEDPEILKKLCELAGKGIGVIVYGSKERLNDPALGGFIKTCVDEDPARLRGVLADFGYNISFCKKSDDVKPPILALSRSDNGLFFSVYNANTTTDTAFRFPFGAPLLCGCEAEMIGGKAHYRFSRGEHRECRAFVEQESGVISCRESPPVNARYRRAIRISGLENATLCLFPEKGCKAAVSVQKIYDQTPIYDTRFTLAEDPVYGAYLKGEQVSGTIFFLMERSCNNR